MSIEHIDRAIQALGGKQKHLAERLGISSPAISRMRDRGQVSQRNVAGIAEILGCDEHDIRPDLYKRPVRDQPGGAAWPNLVETKHDV